MLDKVNNVDCMAMVDNVDYIYICLMGFQAINYGYLHIVDK